MMLRLEFLPLLFILALALTPASSPGISSQTSQLSIAFQSESHQAVGGGCYNAQINVLTQWAPSDNSTYIVNFSNFYLYYTGTNLRISNATNYQQPNNRVTFLVLFPQQPVNVTLSFTRLCVQAGLANLQVFLFYFDGAITVKNRII